MIKDTFTDEIQVFVIVLHFHDIAIDSEIQLPPILFAVVFVLFVYLLLYITTTILD
jgi:hypothetical protein